LPEKIVTLKKNAKNHKEIVKKSPRPYLSPELEQQTVCILSLEREKTISNWATEVYTDGPLRREATVTITVCHIPQLFSNPVQ
jgi:hypothetical protein